MAKWEIKTRTLNIWDNIWWKFVPGVIITVKWPIDQQVQFEMGDGSTVTSTNSDPNDHYRPNLENMCGKQGRDWDWRIGSIMDNTLEIKLRKKHAGAASYFALLWG